MEKSVKIHYSKLRIISIIVLALPVFIFFLTWIRPIISIPASVILAIAIFMSSKTEEKTISVKIIDLLILAGIVLVWLFLVGQGGFFTQKADYLIRNAIFKDMINYSWPVRYGGPDDLSLVYYIGYWIVPSLIGKIFAHFGGFNAGYLTARIAIFAWSFIYVYLTLLLILIKLKADRLKSILIIALVFIFFSGMDAIGSINSGSFDNHIELWAAVFSYSCMTTQIGWVFNQAVPAWLVMAITLNEKNERSYALIGLLLLPSSPLPLIGLICYMFYKAIKNLVSSYKSGELLNRIKIIASPVNILATVVLLPIYWIYYDNNKATEAGVYVGTTNYFVTESSPLLIFIYIAFVLLEFAMLLLLISNKKNISDSIFIAVTLAVFPFIHIGWFIDFCMRASIPMLFLLMVMLMEYFLTNDKKDKFKYVLTIIVFLIGSITPIVEFSSSIRQYVESHGESVRKYDILSGLEDLRVEEKENFIGIDSDDTKFFRYLAKK